MHKIKKVNKAKRANWTHKLVNKVKIFFLERDKFSVKQKLRSSLWALLFALAIVSIIININGFNSSQIYKATLEQAFSSVIGKNLRIYILYLFAGLAVALGFRSGFFNIGIPGQMTVGGGIGLLYLFSEITKGLPLTYARLFLSLLIAIIMGALFAFIAGALKAYLKIHEVVSTILLNWIAYYFFQYVFVRDQSLFKNFSAAPPSSKTLVTLVGEFNVSEASANSISLINNLAIVYGLLAFIILVLIATFLILKKTTWGYRLRMVGMNRDASSYSGSNEKNLIISVFLISGALAGFAGWIWIMIVNSGSIIFTGSPISFGFDAISVALIAFNGPLAIVFSALLYSSLFVGLNNLPIRNANFLALPNQFSFIFVGFIIIFIAASTIFLRFRPLNYLQGKILLLFYSPYYYGLTKKIKLELLKKEQNQPQALLANEEQIRLHYLEAWQKQNYGYFKKIWLHFKLEYCFFKIKYRLAKKLYQKNKKSYRHLQKALVQDYDEIVLQMQKQNKESWWNQTKAKSAHFLKALKSRKRGKIKANGQSLETQNKKQNFDHQNLEKLLELSKKRLVLNQKLNELGYFDKSNLRSEFFSKVYSLWNDLKRYRQSLELEYQNSWKAFWKDFKDFKDFKKMKKVHHKMLAHKKVLIKGLKNV